jgi:hypothetical protein
MERRLTAASRPDISIITASINVASAIAQSSWNPNSAPACADVETDPTSMNPPMLVTNFFDELKAKAPGR